MGLGKFFARKGAVGGTARWVADAFFGALANDAFDFQNCSSSEGLEAELDKIVQYALAVRFQTNPNNPDAQQIYQSYKRGAERGLLGFTIAILGVEAGYYKNTAANMLTFDEVILEELRKKHVGEAILLGEVVSG